MIAIGKKFLWIPYYELTIHKKGILTDHSMDDKLKEAIVKYQQRGYNLKASSLYWGEHTCTQDAGCPSTERLLFGDDHQQLFFFGISTEEGEAEVQKYEKSLLHSHSMLTIAKNAGWKCLHL